MPEAQNHEGSLVELEESTKLLSRVKKELLERKDFRREIFDSMKHDCVFEKLKEYYATDEEGVLRNYVINQFFLQTGKYGASFTVFRDTGMYHIGWTHHESNQDTLSISCYNNPLTPEDPIKHEVIIVSNDEQANQTLKYFARNAFSEPGEKLIEATKTKAKPHIENFLNTLFELE